MLEKILSENWLDKKIFRDFNVRAAIESVLIAIAVTLGGLAAYCHILNMLHKSLEEAVEKNTRTIAYELDKQFNLELESLKQRAKFFEMNQQTIIETPIFVLNEINGRRTGILQPSGEVIVGYQPPDEVVWAVRDAYEGFPIIRYLKNVGLIFAVPIDISGKACVVYDYYDDEAVRKRFNTISYNGDGTVILLNTKDDWTVIADGLSLINTDPEMAKGWESLGKKIGFNSEKITPDKDTGAIFYEFRGEGYFIYYALVSREYNFAISGYVPWASVAVGMDTIYIVMLIIFGLLLVVLLLFGRMTYKTHENKSLKREKFFALQASKTKSDFLSNMSHEIRTPINAILGMDEMILRESKDENVLEYAENLRHAGNSLLGIINDILDFSKIEAGKMEIIPVEYELSSLLNDLVNMIKPRLEKKNLQLETHIDEKIPSILYGDEIRLKQIVTNILTNAVKYTEYGKVTLTVSFEMIEDNSILLFFSVRDTGIGIMEEDISKLFNAFERIEEKRNRTIEGTGLGMNITQQLLELMDSKLQVSSVYGEGSLFSFKVKQKIVNADPIGDFTEAFRNSLKQRKEYHEKFIAPDAKILVVDDTVMNLTVVKGLLKQTKIQIDTADSGYECLKLVKKNHYDIIFLDHRMPGMDGIETLQKMKTLPGNKNHKTPVISLTANAISGAREQYIAAGFQDYLTKPIDSATLENLIIKYLPKEKFQVREVSDEEQEKENLNLPDWLDKIEGLDIKAGVEHCGDTSAYLDALTVFAESVESGAEEIQKYFDASDWKNYTTKVHALKSSARVIGANELSDRAKRLEDAGNSNYIDEIKKFTVPLLELYRSYSEKLSPLIKKDSDDDSDKTPIEPESLNEAYETLREVSASFDYDSLLFILQSLDDFKLPDKDSEKISKIKAAAAKLDWDEIKNLLV